MSNKIKILADCTCDLSEELIKKYDIEIINLIVNMGDKSYIDGIDIFPDDIYSYYRSTGKLTTTAAISPETYYNHFKKWTDNGYSIIHFSISSEMSAGVNNANLAGAELQNVYTIDSQNLSTGIGLLVIETAERIEKEMDIEQIVEEINALRPLVDTSFIVDTLEFLWKGGRCTAIAALGANILKLKPCIEVKNGKMDVGKKYRGSLLKVLNKYVSERLEDMNNIDSKRIFITHSGEFTNDELENIKNEVVSIIPFKEVLITRAGCTISNHCGPKTLGVLFIHKS